MMDLDCYLVRLLYSQKQLLETSPGIAGVWELVAYRTTNSQIHTSGD
ncbi:MAG: hypothetical protein HC835_15715 [Oscillatoriales cyanobacterium RM2_1_1]|nr:hypothetical protein [Oscillatoriales cyanobacterium RM2_1_1]